MLTGTPMKKALDDSVTWGSFTVGLPLLTATNTLSFQDDRFLLSSVKLRPHQRQCRQKATLSPKSATLSPKKGDIVAGVDGALVMVDFSQSLTLSQGRGCDHYQLLNWLCRACDDPRSATAPLLSPLRAHGTVCLTHCTDCHHWNN